MKGLMAGVLLAVLPQPDAGFKRTSLEEVHLKNGEIVTGHIVGQNDTELVLLVDQIRIGIPRVQIREVRKVTRKVRLPIETKPTPQETPAPLPREHRKAEGTEPGPPPLPRPAENLDPDPDKRRYLQALMEELRQADPEQRTQAIDQLSKEDGAGQIYLVQFLLSYPELAQWLLAGIQNIPATDGLPLLASILDRLPVRTRAASILTLGNRKFTPAAEAVAAYLNAEEAVLRGAALDALSLMGSAKHIGSIADLLADADPYVAPRAMRALEALGSAVETRPFVIAELLRWMDSGHVRARNNAAEVAARLKIPEVGGLLARLLNSDDPETRTAAARALGNLGGDDALELLINRLQIELEEPAKIQMIQALGQLGRTEAVDALINVLNDPSRKVQDRAVGALQQITHLNLGKDQAAWRKRFPK